MRSPLTVLVMGLAITAFSLSNASSLVTGHDAGKKQKLAKRSQVWCPASAPNRPAKPDTGNARERSPASCDTAIASR